VSRALGAKAGIGGAASVVARVAGRQKPAGIGAASSAAVRGPGLPLTPPPAYQSGIGASSQVVVKDIPTLARGVVVTAGAAARRATLPKLPTTAAGIRAAYQRDVAAGTPLATVNRLGLHKVATILTNPRGGGVNALSRTDAGIIQALLRAQGAKISDPRGVWGQSSQNALIAQYKRDLAAEQRHFVGSLAHVFYNTGLLHAGEKAPAWFPKQYGTTPTPAELAKILQQGSFSSAMVARSLARRLKDPDVGFVVWRRQQLARIYNTLTGAGLGATFTRPSANSRTMAILLHPASQTPNAQAELRALLQATDYNDFARRVTLYKSNAAQRAKLTAIAQQHGGRGADAQFAADALRRMEEQERAQALGVARQHRSWIAAKMAAYENVLDNLRVKEVGAIIHAVHDPVGYLFHNADQKEVYEERAADWIDGLNSVSHFSFEMLTDPINYIPAGRIAKGVGELTVLGTRVGGKALLATAESDLFRVLERVGIDAGPSLEKMRALGSEIVRLADNDLFVPAARRAVIDGVASFPLTRPIYRGVVLATRTKRAAVQAARTKIVHAGLHGFRPAPTVHPLVAKPDEVAPALARRAERSAAAAGAPPPAPAAPHAPAAAPARPVAPPPHPVTSRTTPRDPVVKRDLDATYTRLHDQLSVHAQNLVQTLQETGASLWSNVVRVPGQLSNVGASLRARMVSHARVIHIHEMGREYGDNVAEAHVRDAAKELAVRVDTKAEFEAFANAHPHVIAEANKLAHDEYWRVVKGAGIYGRGSADPEVYAVLQARVASSTRAVDESILPMLQDLLEEQTARNGDLLYGPDGKWLYSQGEGQAVLRGAARESHEAEVFVDNPMFGQPVTAETARELADGEIAERTAQIKQWYAREVERGNPNDITDERVNQLIADVEDNVVEGWKPERGEDGRQYFVDTREQVGVSPLYAGHLEDSLQVSYADSLGSLDDWEKKIASIGLPKADVLGAPINREIGNLVWTTARGFDPVPGRQITNPIWREGVAKFTGLEAESRVALERAVAERGIAINAAYDHVFSRTLVGEGALYAALSAAQSRPLKVLHTGLSAHLAIWKFAVLPLSPAWYVRNTVDNTAKSLVQGVRDPRAYFPEWLAKSMHGKAGEIQTVFDHNLNAMASLAGHLDRVFGTDVERRLRALMDTFWDHTEETIASILKYHHIEVPGSVISDIKKVGQAGSNPLARDSVATSVERRLGHLERIGVEPHLVDVAAKRLRLTPEEQLAQRNAAARARDWMWDIMGNRPEDAARRRVYQHTYYNAREAHLAAGLPAIEAERKAFVEASAKVEKVLFDYSKISTLEHNLSVFFPFVQFWRKNSGFWLRTAAEKPWVPMAVIQYEEERQRANQDWPEWMRRYVPAKAVTDLVARVPGLSWMANVGAENFFYDPLSFFSFRPLYGLFKEAMGFDNPGLPVTQHGWKFVSGFVDAIEQAGLGINPLFRQPLEHAGIIDQRPWRQVFPQTTLLAALTREFISKTAADILIDIDAAFADPIVQSINALTGNGKLAHEIVADNFEKLVELEMVNQVARGETPSRARATKKLQGLYLVQAVVGTVVGAWLRVMTPEDLYLSKITDSLVTGEQQWADLTAEQKSLITARAYARHGNPAFDDYLDNIPLVQAYFKISDYDSREQFKQEHPQILPFVDPVWRGNPLPDDQMRKQILAVDTQTVMTLHRLFNEGHVSLAVRQAADDVLITPDLKKFWAANDTPQERRDQQRKAAWYRQLDDLNRGYFAIPKTDYDARRDYLKRHPELVDFWNQNNSDADDWKLIANGLLSSMRDVYFGYADAKDWDSANKLLDEHPFLFDHFADDRYVLDRETGRPPAFGERWGMTNHARAYLAAKPFLDQYFALPEGKRAAWLQAGSVAANKVLLYFQDWADPSKFTPKAKAYLAAEADLNYYFENARLNPEYAREWLQSNDPGAARVRRYFAQYGGQSKPKTQYAKDYVAAKAGVEHYFSIPSKQARSKWLAGPTLQARQARAFFNKYPPARGQWQTVRDEGGGGYSRVWIPDLHAIQVRDYLKAKPALDRYFALPEAQRSAWLQRNTADAAAVLTYFNKYADKTPDTQHARDYARAKPSLDKYFALGPEARRAFLDSGSPQAKAVLNYFNKYGDPVKQSRARYKHLITLAGGSAVHAYYQLPAEQRADFLKANTAEAAAARAYFQAHGGIPSGRPTTQHAADYLAAKNGLDVYFAMPEASRRAWLNSDDPLAKTVRDYFAKGYLSIRGITRQAIDYSIARRGLETYFALPPGQRSAWLRSGAPDAALVQHYFQTYSKMHTFERAFRAVKPSSYHTYHPQRFSDKQRRRGRRRSTSAASRPGTIHAHIAAVTDPALRGRLEFWQRFFQLPPSERPAYVKDHAEAAGVFVYGVLGDQQQHDAETSADAQSHIAQGNAVWGVKPFLDLYYSLPPGYDRELLRRANPELAAYLDNQPDALAGDPMLSAALAGYFRLPYGSALRASYLVAHPEVQDYFDSRGPAGGASGIQQVLNVYFAINNPLERRTFLAEHPELNDYFDAKKATRDQFNAITSVFDQTDPRFQPFLRRAEFDVGGAASRMRYKLKLSAAQSRIPDTLARRVYRQPVT